MSRDILARLATPEVVALRCRGSVWPRSMFSQPLIPDAWMGLVEQPDGRRRFVPAGEDPQPQRDDMLILVRNRAITVPLGVADVPAACDHPVSATIELLVRWPARDDDLAALHRALLSDNELTLERLSVAVRDNGAEPALRAFIRGQTADALVHDDVRDALLQHLRSELKRFLFNAGLECERLGRVEFTSGSLAQEQALARETARRVQELEARGVVERAARAATQHRLDDLGSVLAKLKAAAASDENVRWHELLPALTPSERGRLLENLWRLTPDRKVATALVVVAGRECVWLSPTEPERVLRQVTLPAELGGLRSVVFDTGRDELLVGGASGIWRLQAGDGGIVQHYAVRCDQPPQTGFNAAITLDGRLFATHSQLGAWSWALDDPADAQPLLQPAAGQPQTIRAVVATGAGLVLLAADDRVCAFGIDGEQRWQSAAADGSIHCLSPLENEVYAGTSRGSLLRCDLQRPGEWLLVHRALGAIESIDARRWDDLIELVIPAGPDGVHGVYGAQGIVARLLRSPHAIRRAWASDDALMALTEHRDRLIVLNAALADRGGVEVPVARMLGHSIQDGCIVSSDEATLRLHSGQAPRRSDEGIGA